MSLPVRVVATGFVVATMVFRLMPTATVAAAALVLGRRAGGVRLGRDERRPTVLGTERDIVTTVYA